MVVARNEFIDERVARYVADHASPLDSIVGDLRAATKTSAGDFVRMQIGDDQALFMEMLARAMGCRLAIEIGTFTGMSALALARGMGTEGRLICLDVSEEWTAIAREFWNRAGVSERIDLRLGPALQSLRDIDEKEFDLAFIDADKISYLSYYEALIPLLRPGGLILADNTLQSGGVADENNESDNTRAMREFNDHVVADRRVVTVLLPIADGVTIVQKL